MAVCGQRRPLFSRRCLLPVRATTTKRSAACCCVQPFPPRAVGRNAPLRRPCRCATASSARGWCCNARRCRSADSQSDASLQRNRRWFKYRCLFPARSAVIQPAMLSFPRGQLTARRWRRRIVVANQDCSWLCGNFAFCFFCGGAGLWRWLRGAPIFCGGIASSLLAVCSGNHEEFCSFSYCGAAE